MADLQQQRIRGALRDFLAGGRLDLPEGAGVLWQVFVALHETRGGGMGGPQPITFAEIEAYARLMRWPLAPHHVATIRAMDREWIQFVSRQDGAAPKSGVSAGSVQPINPAAFDAVFG